MRAAKKKAGGESARRGESGEREADSLFGFIAELGALLRGEQSDATLQAVDDKMTPPSRVRPTNTLVRE